MLEIFEKENVGAWVAIVALSTILIYFFITIAMRIYFLKLDKKREDKSPDEIAHSFVYEPEYFFNGVMELMISNTCILGVGFLYSYISTAFKMINDWMGIILLILIVLAIIGNNCIDKYWLNRWWEEGNKYSKVNLRLASSISILFVIVFISLLFKSKANYQFALCMLGLVLGRFIYFDSSISGLAEEIKKVLQCWPCFLVAIVLMGVLIGTGFIFGIINPSNAVETLFIAHFLYLTSTNVALKVWSDLLK